ncbi:tRNA (C5-cytosine) methyltransferase, NCL1 [Penicillium griseofulvum]|uniref:tRNA (C5-cytosine) methyltransferase, NCL1 n=1 Tax=Penicillium patulum TaxID=5078 RepID=A0A135LNX4_PENPA|nr:tRNA (C5-cytosine) methyltransferase, NCL1 [Penicillium griseofulvum]KXG50666.1 tRNA (C5-cytosine) methyltransferase, NCL1 [Penicillium griseofulvum]
MAQFATLPAELRQMIWEFALPARVVEIGEPCDPDIIPEEDLRKAWILNRKHTAIAHVCWESRQIALARSKPPKGVTIPPDCMTDIRWWWNSTDIVHFNAPPEVIEARQRCRLVDNLLDLEKVPILSKKVSISADVVHPFLRFRNRSDMPKSLIWEVLCSMETCIIALHTVCIRATNEQARELGLFGNGDEPAQLIDPFDKTAIQRFRQLWNNTKQEVSSVKFFDTVDTGRFTFRVERWLAEMSAEYIDFKWTDPPFPTPAGPRNITALLRRYPDQRHSPDAKQYLVEFPTLELRIMFRLCPPAVNQGGKGRGGGGAGRTRSQWQDITRENEKFERYYNEPEFLPEEEKELFWATMRKDLPNSFRFTGSRGHALAVQQRLKDHHIPEITSIKYENEFVEPPRPVSWYPDQLAWSMTTPKNVIRRFAPFASFQKFLVAETDVGNISRQEVVSMIPPLLIDARPGMTVLDMCAAPGSKSAQLMELLHAGEEDAIAQVTEQIKNGTAGPEPLGPEGLNDDGRSTGLLIANDADYKRAHMLIHQMKRLSSPNLIVTNHDATMFPSIKLPPLPTTDGSKPKNRYLKFDRILADVPCSGDGTARKNVGVWKDWTPGNALGLYSTQSRILVRALQMLKVGGRVVYSTCSLNPVENEAVIASAIERCGGAANVKIIDCSQELPGLKRSAGLKTWKVMDREGRMWNNWQEIEEHRNQEGINGLARLAEGMFAPTGETANLPLDRCMRVYPHQQDTGGFFITVLEKTSEIKAKPESSNVIPKASVAALAAELDSKKNEVDGKPLEKLESLDELVTPDEAAEKELAKNATVAESSHQLPYSATLDASIPVSLPKRDADDLEEAVPAKRTKLDDGSEVLVGDRPVHVPAPAVGTGIDTTGNSTPAAPAATTQSFKKKGPRQEEPFKYLDPNHEELLPIYEFYKLSDRFPRDRFMVRNAEGLPTRTIYYTSALGRDILTCNEGQGMKFVHCGVKMFVKQDAQRENVCRWRVQTDGLKIIEPWLGPERSVVLTKRETMRRLLVEMFPKINDDEDGWKSLGEIGEQVKDIPMGCSILRVQATGKEDGLPEAMVLPLWRSLHSLNLMLPKEERRAMLLRIFNDSTPLVNTTQKKGGKTESTAEAEEVALMEENAEVGQEAQDDVDERETYTKDGDEEDRFNTTV